MKKHTVSCSKCGGENCSITPKIDVRIRGAGCLSLAIFLSGFSIIGIVFWGYMFYRIRKILIPILIVIFYCSILTKIQGRPAGTAVCQDCGKQWNVNKRGRKFRSYILIKALVLLLIFIGSAIIFQKLSSV